MCQAQDSRRVGEAGIVAEHDTVARARRDRIGADAPDDGLVAGAEGDRIIAARRRRIRLDRGQEPCHIGNRAIVAEHDIVARARRDAVSAGAAKDDAVAYPDGYRIRAAIGRISGPCQAQCSGRVDEASVISDNEVGAGPHGDPVGSNAADDDLVAGAKRDRVIATRSRRIGRDTGQNPGVPRDRTVVS